MLRFTERIGERELVFEGETVKDILELKRALNPTVVVSNTNVKCGTVAPEKLHQQIATGVPAIGTRPWF
ncbi:hypothetical protein [uncultured Brevibacillus sp.]|uniref:hypothetical protein n=1 Tax=uncultured Brevibacillus sp. TaxID=169970 RepID=UPI002596F445|nr:hypothetical protein [uncultured Brevibacillus sp.]